MVRVGKVWLEWERCGWSGEGVVGVGKVWLEWGRCG